MGCLLPAPAAALASLLLACVPARAGTFLLAVDERVDGVAVEAPRPVTEGVLAALFEADHIVFDLPPAADFPSMAGLRQAAAEAGAAFVLCLRVQSRVQRTEEGAARIASAIELILSEAEGGGELVRVRFEAGNAAREREVDAAALGREIGREVVARLPGPAGAVGTQR